jgi:hypothetical protein
MLSWGCAQLKGQYHEIFDHHITVFHQTRVIDKKKTEVKNLVTHGPFIITNTILKGQSHEKVDDLLVWVLV